MTPNTKENFRNKKFSVWVLVVVVSINISEFVNLQVNRFKILFESYYSSAATDIDYTDRLLVMIANITILKSLVDPTSLVHVSQTLCYENIREVC